jgi:hypothetical protein
MATVIYISEGTGKHWEKHGCRGCPLARRDDFFGDPMYCEANGGGEVKDDGSIPETCPLRSGPVVVRLST